MPRKMATDAVAIIDAFCDQIWLEDGLAASSLASYRRDLSAWSGWLEKKRGRGLLGAERIDVETFLAEQFGARAKVTSIHRRLSSLRRFYRMQASNGTMPCDYTPRAAPPTVPRGLCRRFTEAQ